MKTAYLLLFVFMLSGCGIFKKKRLVEKESVKKEVLSLDIDDINVIDKKTGISTEVKEITIKKPGNIVRKDTFDVHGWELLYNDIISAIDGSEEVIVRTTTHIDTTQTIQDKSTRTRELSEKIDSSSVSRDIDKSSDTTFLSNFNPWVILGVAFMIIAAVFLYFRLKRS